MAMSIVITTPTGNIGAKLTQKLLDNNEKITVIARDPAKVEPLAKRGARIISGSHADTKVLVEATRGAKALFVLTPPDLRSADLRAEYQRYGKAAAEAISQNGIPYVVHLSSVGADLDHDNGPVIGLHDNEKYLNETQANVTHLRAGYFMENTLWQVGPIQQQRSMFAAINGNTKIPMIATMDIASAAASALLNTSWSGKRIVEVQGAADITYNDVAKVLSEVLGLEVMYTQISHEQAKAGFVGMGASEHMADLLNQLSAGLDKGVVRFREPRSTSNTTPTSYAQFAQETFLPMFKSR
jgi:uncharacterized protein YbjT (DUF2867 family)